jgi:hypothetical protein
MALEDPMVMLRGLVNASSGLMLKLAVNRFFDFVVDPGVELTEFDILDIFAQVLIQGDAVIESDDEIDRAVLRDMLDQWFPDGEETEEEK